MEVIIYIALLGTLLSGSITTALALADGAERNAHRIARRGEAAFIEDKIRWSLVNARDILIAADGAVLIVQKRAGQTFDTADNPIRIYEEDSALMIKRGSKTALPLNSERFPVREFRVNVESNALGTAVFVEFQIEEDLFHVSFTIDTD